MNTPKRLLTVDSHADKALPTDALECSITHLQALIERHTLCESYLLAIHSSLKQAKLILDFARSDAKFIRGYIAGLQASGQLSYHNAQLLDQQVTDLLKLKD